MGRGFGIEEFWLCLWSIISSDLSVQACVVRCLGCMLIRDILKLHSLNAMSKRYVSSPKSWSDIFQWCKTQCVVIFALHITTPLNGWGVDCIRVKMTLRVPTFIHSGWVLSTVCAWWVFSSGTSGQNNSWGLVVIWLRAHSFFTS